MASALGYVVPSKTFQLVLCFWSSLFHFKLSQANIGVRAKTSNTAVVTKFSISGKDKVQVVEGKELANHKPDLLDLNFVAELISSEC